MATSKRGTRLSTERVVNRDDFADVLAKVLAVLDQTDDMFPVIWNSVRIESVEGGIKVSAMTEDPDIPGIMEVEPTINLHPTPGTNGLTTGGELYRNPAPLVTQPASPNVWPDILP